MPKFVDHDQRRHEIVLATWRLVEREGVRAVTMRQVAGEAGFANGALAPYFRNKDAIITAAFEHIYTTMIDSSRDAAAGKRGLDALWEVIIGSLPLTEDGLHCARVLVPFWEEAHSAPERREIHARHVDRWRQILVQHLEEARDDGQVRHDIDICATTETIQAFVTGAQTLAVLEADRFATGRLEQLAHICFAQLPRQEA